MSSICDSRRRISIQSLDEKISHRLRPFLSARLLSPTFRFRVLDCTPLVSPVSPSLRLGSPSPTTAESSRLSSRKVKSRSRDHRQTRLPPSLVEPENFPFPPALVPWVRSASRTKTEFLATRPLQWVKSGYLDSENFSVGHLPLLFCIEKVTYERKKFPNFDPGWQGQMITVARKIPTIGHSEPSTICPATDPNKIPDGHLGWFPYKKT